MARYLRHLRLAHLAELAELAHLAELAELAELAALVHLAELAELAEPVEPGPPATYYFNRVKQAVCVLPRLHLQEVGVHELRPMTPSPRWYRLVRLAAQLGTDLYPDYSVSAVAMLHAYGLEHVSTQAQCSALIQRLRQWPIPPAPTLYTAARSVLANSESDVNCRRSSNSARPSHDLSVCRASANCW